MLALRQEIYSLIRSKTNLPVYSGLAPIGTAMPYITYDFFTNMKQFDTYQCMLTLDLWDNKEDTTNLETLTDTLIKGMDKATKTTAEVGFTVYTDSVMVVPDPNPEIKRNRLNFVVLAYFN